jgi:predicted RNase H-like HicB family nuclease
MSLKLTVIYRQEGKWHIAHCPELGVTSQGETFDAAQDNIKEAIELYLEDAPEEELKRFTGTPLIKTIEINKV